MSEIIYFLLFNIKFSSVLDLTLSSSAMETGLFGVQSMILEIFSYIAFVFKTFYHSRH